MLLLIPGPVRTHPDVRAAMAADIAPWDNDFRPVYAGIRERVRALAGGVEGEHATLPLQGCGHFILEAAVRTFVPAGGQGPPPLTRGGRGGRAPTPPAPGVRALRPGRGGPHLRPGRRQGAAAAERRLRRARGP